MGIIGKADTRTGKMREHVEKAIRRQLAQYATNEDSKVLDGIQKFLITAQLPPVTVGSVIHEAAWTIFRTFSFKEVSIGLKSLEDGMYRYEEFVGISKPVEEALRKMSYTYDDYFSQKEYPSIRLSKVTELCIVEENPGLEFEKETYDPGTFTSGPRGSPDEFKEGDYIDVAMYTPEDEMIGWIEVSKPLHSKMPSIVTIRRLELFASVLSIMIQSVRLAKK